MAVSCDTTVLDWAGGFDPVQTPWYDRLCF